MCAYNRLNGVYCSEHDWLLNTVLREEWGFDGAVMTDWGAANDRPLGVKAGLDLEMPSSGGINDALVAQAVEDGTLDEAILDRAIARNITLSLSSAEQTKACCTSRPRCPARTGQKSRRTLLRAAAKHRPRFTAIRTIQSRTDWRLCEKTPLSRRRQLSGQTHPGRDPACGALRTINDLTYAPGYDPVASQPQPSPYRRSCRLA